jgi:FKBP-type peptidyl-prolyl cis-trans isomerase
MWISQLMVVLKRWLSKKELENSQRTNVNVNYIGKFEDGKVFDQSDAPFTFKLGAGQVIKGWDLGVASMKKGEKAEFNLRYDYAYGEKGYAKVIPPKATLIFTVELL